MPLVELAQYAPKVGDAVPYLTSQPNKAMQPLTFEQIDCLCSLIEFHDDWDEVSELMGTDVELLHEILTEMRDAA